MCNLRIPYLTKSSFVTARKCEKWLWNSFHARKPNKDNAPGSVPDIGDRIGRFAHKLFPEGVEITEQPWEHEEAFAKTQRFMADNKVTEIFEAALEHEDVRIRVDVLERLDDNTWGIREVKSTGTVRNPNRTAALKEKYYRDVGIQFWVASGYGLNIASVELLYICKDFLRQEPGFLADDIFHGVPPEDFFVREEVLDEVTEFAAGAAIETGELMAILAQDVPPQIEPSKKRCTNMPGGNCPYWAECTDNKPDDWVDILYYPKIGQLEALKLESKHSIGDLEIVDGKKPEQERMIQAVQTNEDIFLPTLNAALEEIILPALHLDFEYLNGIAAPLFSGTLPFQKVPFQYSVHRIDEDGVIEHVGEFLAEEADGDPRPKFVESLVDFFEGRDEHIIVYNADGAEIPVIDGLINQFQNFDEPLSEIKNRIKDLLPIIRNNVMLRSMISKESLLGGGLFSLKNVAPALVEDFSYDNLENVTNGIEAVEGFFQLLTGELPKTDKYMEGIPRNALRENMRAYCEKDTEATALMHQRLLKIAGRAA